MRLPLVLKNRQLLLSAVFLALLSFASLSLPKGTLLSWRLPLFSSLSGKKPLPPAESHLLAENHHLKHSLQSLQLLTGTLAQSSKLSLHLHEIPTDLVLAKVIYRSLDPWNRTIWLNVGSLGGVHPGSAVVVGEVLVGVVTAVTPQQAEVRLITHPEQPIPVRVCRGSPEAGAYCHHIEQMLTLLTAKPPTEEEQWTEEMRSQLLDWRAKLQEGVSTEMLAKGELIGATASDSQALKGVGFNYDYPDQYGAGKNLWEEGEQAILQEQDLLVTSGLDGLLPGGLLVAQVETITPLREGESSYSLTASPIHDQLNRLEWVSIIPSLQ